MENSETVTTDAANTAENSQKTSFLQQFKQAVAVKSFADVKKKHAIWAFLLGFGLSFSSVAGYLYDQTSFLSADATTPVIIVLLGVVLSVLFYCLLVWVTREKAENAENSTPRWQPSNKEIGIAVALFVVPQLFMWLVVWPGIYGGDAPEHVLQVLPTFETSVFSRLSVPYTLFLGGAIEIGRQLGSREAAFSLAMYIQMTVIIYVQVKTAIFIGRETGSKKFFWVVTAFLALHPFGILIRMYSCQDVFFCAFLMLMLIEALQISRNVSAGEQIQKKTAIRFVVFAVLMCLMRANGVFFLALAVLCMLPSLIRKKRGKTVAVLATPVVLAILITGPVYTLCGVTHSEVTFKQMSSISSQQLARSYALNKDSFTEEDEAEFERFYPGITEDVETWYWKYEEISDHSKNLLDNEAVKNDIPGYLKFYFSIGAKNVGNYLDAYMMNTLGWWYPFKHYPDDRLYHYYAMYRMKASNYYGIEGYQDVQRTSIWPSLDEQLTTFVMDSKWSDVPVLNVFLNAGMWTWVFFTLCAIAILKKRSDMKFPFFIVAFLFLSLLASPLCYFRYAYGLLVCLPLLAMVACGTVPKSEANPRTSS